MDTGTHKMTKEIESFMKLEVDALTGATLEREMTANEIAEVMELRAQKVLHENEQQAKTAAKASALAKLADLGLTAEEIAAL